MTPLGPDGTWLEMPEAALLREVAGGVLAVALVASVAALGVGSLLWALERAGVVTLSQRGLMWVGRSVLGAVILGGLSGIVGFGTGAFTVAMS